MIIYKTVLEFLVKHINDEIIAPNGRRVKIKYLVVNLKNNSAFIKDKEGKVYIYKKGRIQDIYLYKEVNNLPTFTKVIIDEIYLPETMLNVDTLFRLYILSHLAPKDYNYKYPLNRKDKVIEYLKGIYGDKYNKLLSNKRLYRILYFLILQNLTELDKIKELNWDKEKNKNQRFYKKKCQQLSLIIHKEDI